ncbi:MAG: O-antigen ligase family protein [Acidobacteria bacterium]|nr:O-antigen ligase family protein [Acidobacteriota bacterium]
MKRVRLEQVAVWSFYGFVGALQWSIFAAEVLAAAMAICWIAMLVKGRARIDAPRFFWPLVAYAVLTLVSAVFSVDPATSIEDCKQLLLFAVVPATYEIARAGRARTAITIAITLGAASAAYGVMQFGLLHFDSLGQRPHGTMGHYMQYSGLLMMVTTAAAARVLFDTRDRTWPAVVLPALMVALALTFTRSAWVGTGVALALLFLIKDVRLVGVLPVLLIVFFTLAPLQVKERMYSMFDMKDPTNRDRIAMLREGAGMVAANPLTGMGPNMVERVYVRFRDPEAVERINPHLHNVPMQIAAERGLLALGAWLWFVGSAAAGLVALMRRSRSKVLPATGLGTIAAMLGAGMFEHNFGASIFLMFFLVLLTLPFAAERPRSSASADSPEH